MKHRGKSVPPPRPTYREVCSGRTGHAEVVEVAFDPEGISLHDLLTVFFTTHDPTTLNRQGGDRGTQYRSGIYVTSEAQREVEEAYASSIDERSTRDRNAKVP